MNGSPLDHTEAARRARAIIDPARSYESASDCGKLARDVLALLAEREALLEIAQAAQAIPAEILAMLPRIRAALARHQNTT